MFPNRRLMFEACILVAVLAACLAKGSEESSISLASTPQPTTIASLEATISAIVEPSAPATVEPIETVASVKPQPTDTSTTEPEPTGTTTPKPSVTLVTTSPSTTSSPGVSETPISEAEQAPMVELEEGFVNYTFTDSESGESIDITLPEHVASAVSLAETQPGQTHKGAPLAYARIEGEPGSRVFRVGNIDIATEGPNGFTVNSELTNESGYLGYDEAVGFVEHLGGGVDPETVQGDTFIYPGELLYVPGVGTINRTFFDRLTPMSATRTQILLVTEDGNLVETAMMRIVMGYRDGDGNLVTIEMDAHHMIYQDDAKQLVADWIPPFGDQQQKSLVFSFSSNEQDLEGRREALNNGELLFSGGNTAFEQRLIGYPEMTPITSFVGKNRVRLPDGALVAVDNNN